MRATSVGADGDLRRINARPQRSRLCAVATGARSPRPALLAGRAARRRCTSPTTTATRGIEPVVAGRRPRVTRRRCELAGRPRARADRRARCTTGSIASPASARGRSSITPVASIDVGRSGRARARRATASVTVEVEALTRRPERSAAARRCPPGWTIAARAAAGRSACSAASARRCASALQRDAGRPRGGELRLCLRRSAGRGGPHAARDRLPAHPAADLVHAGRGARCVPLDVARQRPDRRLHRRRGRRRAARAATPGRHGRAHRSGDGARDADLDKCDAIVTGIRAYNTVPALARFQPRAARLRRERRHAASCSTTPTAATSCCPARDDRTLSRSS